MLQTFFPYIDLNKDPLLLIGCFVFGKLARWYIVFDQKVYRYLLRIDPVCKGFESHLAKLSHRNCTRSFVSEINKKSRLLPIREKKKIVFLIEVVLSKSKVLLLRWFCLIIFNIWWSYSNRFFLSIRFYARWNTGRIK